MDRDETKEYCKERFETLARGNPQFPRTHICNLIMQELWNSFGIRLTTFTGHNIVSVQEVRDHEGHYLSYEVDNLAGVPR